MSNVLTAAITLDEIVTFGLDGDGPVPTPVGLVRTDDIAVTLGDRTLTPDDARALAELLQRAAAAADLANGRSAAA